MRRLFTIVSALSLVLCLACVGMWVRTCVKGDLVTWEERNGDSWVLVSAIGRVKLERTSYELTRKIPLWWLIEEDAMFRPRASFRPGASPTDAESHWPVCYTLTKVLPSGFRIQRVWILPYWLPTLAGAILPGLWLWKERKRKIPPKVGLCQKCGYDLRASPERCPECGTAVPSLATSAAPSRTDPA